jgi:hypothetical protein
MAVDPLNDEPGTAGAANAAANNGLDPAAATETLEVINSMIATQFQGGMLRTQMQTQPCEAAGFIREIMTTVLQDKLTWRVGWADKAAAFLGGWIRESLLAQGRPRPGIHGGMELSRFMIEFGPREDTGSGFIPFVIRTALLGLGPEMDWLEPHLPTGSELASGAWRNNMSASARVRDKGEKLGPGIYLYPKASMWDPTRAGSKLRGPGVRRIIEQWVDFQSANVSGDLSQGWNGTLGPRQTLVKMVGTDIGTGPYGTWQRSDGALSGSRVYTMELLWSDAESLLEEASDLCTLKWEIEQELAETLSDISAEQARADIRAAERKAAREEKALIGALVVAGLFVLTS